MGNKGVLSDFELDTVTQQTCPVPAELLKFEHRVLKRPHLTHVFNIQIQIYLYSTLKQPQLTKVLHNSNCITD